MNKSLVYGGKTYSDFLINENGQILNLKTKNILKPYKHSSGYYFVSLPMGKRGRVKMIRLHKALAETFIPNPENFNIVNHIDENKGNYNLSNLEWVTSKINTEKHLELKSKENILCNNRKLSPKDVVYIRNNKGILSCYELAKKFNCSKTTIINAQNNILYKHIID